MQEGLPGFVLNSESVSGLHFWEFRLGASGGVTAARNRAVQLPEPEHSVEMWKIHRRQPG